MLRRTFIDAIRKHLGLASTVDGCIVIQSVVCRVFSWKWIRLFCVTGESQYQIGKKRDRTCKVCKNIKR